MYIIIHCLYYIHNSMLKCMYTFVHIYTPMHTNVHKYLYTSAYIYLCIYAYRMRTRYGLLHQSRKFYSVITRKSS